MGEDTDLQEAFLRSQGRCLGMSVPCFSTPPQSLRPGSVLKGSRQAMPTMSEGCGLADNQGRL